MDVTQLELDDDEYGVDSENSRLDGLASEVDGVADDDACDDEDICELKTTLREAELSTDADSDIEELKEDDGSDDRDGIRDRARD